ncbi:Ppx/GppA phosphatase family protein [Leadbetterella byssophila]|uniref:Ppx/GppA phosphatase n=1 Tax=Leadbetterella byssophila (strain DSM 17132 / JCM 16389 / KACC 11308 / NBRC 106382 / 4M15) TaxID=649349 RepID=E4RTN0_LEAB4|nr:phosphatase [Leadbetterella byssophila]ADQ16887.1 Ppx/GppA phosphatase [Leadbetterella byssophila DSM 17132]
MKIAAIDIGSNAARMQISSVLNDEGKAVFKKVEYVRFALRLGHDVFRDGKIGYDSEAKLKKLLTVYRLLMELHEVDAYLICATSALREAENGLNICERVKLEMGMTINLISGEKEAEMINNVIVNELDPDKTYLHIDVGGGSTELNVYNGKIKETSQSFKIGSVRLMEGKVNRDMWKKMQRWIADNVPTDQPVYAIGTGGNISKIFEYVPKDEYGMGTLEDIEKAVEYFNQYTFEERVNKLKMNPDRADVVTYAADIYLSAMRWAKANLMAVPDLGLKDGIMLEVYQNLLKEA